jgi:hypothetical protein
MSDIGGKIEAVLDGGPAASGLNPPSWTGRLCPPVYSGRRITKEQLERDFSEVEIDEA